MSGRDAAAVVDRWDLSPLDLGAGVDGVRRVLKEALERWAPIAEADQGRLADLDATHVAGVLHAYGAVHDAILLMRSWTSMRIAEDVDDDHRTAMAHEIDREVGLARSAVAFVDDELAALSDAELAALVREPALAFCRRHLIQCRARSARRLTADAEAVLSSVAMADRASWLQLHETVLDRVRVDCGDGTERGIDAALGQVRAVDRDVRRSASAALGVALAENVDVVGAAYAAVAVQQARIDALRGQPSWRAGALEDDIGDEHLEPMVATVRSGFGLARRWWRLRSAALGIAAPEHHDRMAPIALPRATWTLDEAAELVIETYDMLAPELGTLTRRAFENGWIDAAPRPGKRSGAFCAPTVPRAHPYVLMSFSGGLHDLLTLVHEVGHALHLALASEQGIFHARPPAALNEVASTVGEALLLDRLAERWGPDGTGLLARGIDAAVTDVFRQVAIHVMEDEVHRRARADEPLTAAAITEIWMATQLELHGDAVRLGPGYEHWWSFLPHIVRTPGYCVTYAFGQLLTLMLLDRRATLGDAFGPAYVALLRTGSSRLTVDLMADLGLDLRTPTVWADALRVLDRRLDEFEAACPSTVESARGDA